MLSTEARKLDVRLTDDQRRRLTDLTRNGTASAKKIRHARILLLADAVDPDGRRTDESIAEILEIHVTTVKRTRWKFVRRGEAPALDRKLRQTPPVPPKIDGRVEAHLVAISCSPPPEGQTRWTLKLLAGELKGRGLVTEVCVETVRKTLKKRNQAVVEAPVVVHPGAGRRSVRGPDGASPRRVRPASQRRGADNLHGRGVQATA